jgi:hypothetical protein
MGYQASPVIEINFLVPLNTYLDNFQELFCDRKQITYFIHLPDLITPPLTAPTHRLKALPTLTEKVSQSWELNKFAQFCMIRCLIQKLCRIGKSWKPLKKLEAGEVATFVLKRIWIQQRFRCASKIGTICFGLFEPNRAIAPAEYSLPFLKSENHLRNPLKQ